MGKILRLGREYELKFLRYGVFFLIAAAAAGFSDVLLVRLSGSVSQTALEGNTAGIVRLLLIMSGVTGLQALSGAAAALLSERFGARAGYGLRGGYAKRLAGLPFARLSEKSPGDLLSVYTNDLPAVGRVFSDELPTLLADLLTLLVSAVFMALIQPWLTLVFFLLFPPLTLMQMKLSGPIQKYAREASRKKGEYNAAVNDSLQNIAVVAAYSLEERMENRCLEQYAGYFDAQMKRIKVFSVLIISGLSATLIPVFFICCASALLVASGRMAAGEFVALTSISLSANTFLTMLSQRFNNLQGGAAAADRIFESARGEPEEDGGLELLPVPGAPAFELEHISFSYESGEPGEDGEGGRRILKDISLSVAQGSRVAIVGASGSGKSTLLKLLLSLYRPGGGRMRILGVDAGAAPGPLRRLISYVPQDSFLFPISIRENLRIAREGEPDPEEMERACAAAGILPFVKGLPKGFDTVLTEAGENLSGGQKQRLAIARAIYRNAPLILMDEATSGLDAVTEKAVLEAFFASAEGKTAVMVAHRPAVARLCDRIIVMESGRVAEDGSFDELMEKDGVFAALYRQSPENKDAGNKGADEHE